MVDGVSVLAQMMWTMKSTGELRDQREAFLLDGGAPFYRCYETADGKYVAVGAIEPQFFAELLTGLGLSADEVRRFHCAVRRKDSRRVGRDIRRHRRMCHSGVDVERSRRDPHLTARATVINTGGVDQAAPAPRFSRTPAGPVGPPPPATTPLAEIGW
jgi:alpha-methylacyl-CoA racemase